MARTVKRKKTSRRIVKRKIAGNNWRLDRIEPYTSSKLSFIYSNKNRVAKYVHREVDINFNTGEARVHYLKSDNDNHPDLKKLKLTKKKLQYWHNLANKNQDIIDF